MTGRAGRAISGLALPCALLVLAAVAPAAATAANRQRLQVTIDPAGGRLDGGSRPVTLHFRLSRSTDSGAISSPAAEDRFLLPRGFAVHPAALRQCDLNVLIRKGPSAGRACQIGSGTLQLAALTVNPTPPAAGTVTIFNARPRGGRARIVTYALVTQPIRSEFWFKSDVRPTRRGDVIVVRETRLSIYGVPLTVLALDFTFGRAVGHGAGRRAYMTGPPRCGPAGSRIFGLRTTFYDPFTGAAPAGPPLLTSEPASC